MRPIDDISAGLYDDDDFLTLQGADFFDQMENDMATRGGLFIRNYLQSEDSDLYNWALSNNPYDYAPDKLGASNNASSFKTMVGMTSKDDEYVYGKSVWLNSGAIEGTVKNVEQSLLNLKNAFNSEKTYA